MFVWFEGRFWWNEKGKMGGNFNTRVSHSRETLERERGSYYLNTGVSHSSLLGNNRMNHSFHILRGTLSF
uniref:Uncharacterized protein n=1 Tax=Nelumbo nucifera TaxID=4432 RepID=A0A822ZK91_NELNU|nr:TPA_asm: hypothetical protein HUJ06_003373 [Nelumbo nucifera]